MPVLATHQVAVLYPGTWLSAALGAHRGIPLADFAHVPDTDGDTAVGPNDDVSNLLNVGGEANALDQMQLAGLDDIAATDIQVIRSECQKHIIQSEIVFHQSDRVGKHVYCFRSPPQVLTSATPGMDLSRGLITQSWSVVSSWRVWWGLVRT